MKLQKLKNYDSNIDIMYIIKQHISNNFNEIFRNITPQGYKSDIDIIHIDSIIKKLFTDKDITKWLKKSRDYLTNQKDFKTMCQYMSLKHKVMEIDEINLNDILDGYINDSSKILEKYIKLNPYIAHKINDKLYHPKDDNYYLRISIINDYITVLSKYINHQIYLVY